LLLFFGRGVVLFVCFFVVRCVSFCSFRFDSLPFCPRFCALLLFVCNLGLCDHWVAVPTLCMCVAPSCVMYSFFVFEICIFFLVLLLSFVSFFGFLCFELVVVSYLSGILGFVWWGRGLGGVVGLLWYTRGG